MKSVADRPQDHTPSAGAAPAADTAGLPVPPPLLYLFPFLAGVLLHHTVGGDRIPSTPGGAIAVLGWLLLTAGGALIAVPWVLFHRARTSVLPFRPTTAIVTSGPYRFSRNPIYLGMALVYLGLPLLLGYAWPYLFFPPAVFLIMRLVIVREERYLEGKFGDEYRRYRDSVRRWI
jgi:protein-S-isoprenylcysteine O-methyltransferase Ste14